MNTHLYALLCGAVLSTTACSSAPPPQPASAMNSQARPLALAPGDDGSSASKVTQIHIDQRITDACNMPTPHFDFDSSAIRNDDGLDALAVCFTTGPMRGQKLALVGHADPRGETEYNLGLGQRRAGEVEKYLETKGVDESRVSTSSRGAMDAIGTDETTWAADRHVDILLGR